MTAGGAPHLREVDLLRLADGEGSAGERAAWRAHAAACADCAARLHALVRLAADTTAVLREDTSSSDAADARTALDARATLAARLAREPDRSSRPAPRRIAALVARWSTVAAAIVAVLLTARALTSRARGGGAPAIEHGALPNAALTPGATDEITMADVCGGSRGPAPADPEVRQRILHDYGMAGVPDHEYELDYLITPQLGGANDPRNLWPERYTDRTWNARVKDQLEDLLPGLVCEGKVDLRTAQREIAANWIQAYKKYFRTDTPLRTRDN